MLRTWLETWKITSACCVRERKLFKVTVVCFSLCCTVWTHHDVRKINWIMVIETKALYLWAETCFKDADSFSSKCGSHSWIPQASCRSLGHQQSSEPAKSTARRYISITWLFECPIICTCLLMFLQCWKKTTPLFTAESKTSKPATVEQWTKFQGVLDQFSFPWWI